MSVIKEYEIHTADGFYAAVAGPESYARREVLQYMFQLGPDDGKVTVYEVIRKEIDPYDYLDSEPPEQWGTDPTGGSQGGSGVPAQETVCH